MPHIKKWLIDGQLAPSVNQVTDMIPKEWLIAWYRKVGFEEADRISKTSRDHGTNIHDLFDRFWKGELKSEQCTELEAKFVDSLSRWATNNKVEVLRSEPHLESHKYIFHGSPDLAIKVDGRGKIADYKIKDKYPDYKTILNEAGYAIMYEEMYGVKLEDILILNFDKETGELKQIIDLPIKPEYKNDFLTLRAAYDVKIRANEWDDEKIRSKFKRK